MLLGACSSPLLLNKSGQYQTNFMKHSGSRKSPRQAWYCWGSWPTNLKTACLHNQTANRHGLRFFPLAQLVDWAIARPSYRPNTPPIPDSYKAPKNHFIYPYVLGFQLKIHHTSYWAHGPLHFITSRIGLKLHIISTPVDYTFFFGKQGNWD